MAKKVKEVDPPKRKQYKGITKGFVYFIQEEDHGSIKIGYSTKNPLERLKSIQGNNPRRLHIAGTIETLACQFVEGELHKKFDAYHISGEWFDASLELVEFIRSDDAIKEFLRNIRSGDVVSKPREAFRAHIDTIRRVCESCKIFEAVTKNGCLCKGCLKDWLDKNNHVYKTISNTNPDKRAAIEFEPSPWQENAVRDLEDR